MVCVLGWVVGCSEKPVKIVVQVDNINAHVELVDTEETRRQGLMHREHLDKDEGLLIAFSQSQTISLWMLNTPLPLDVGFFDEQGRLFQIEHMEPDGGKTIHSSVAPGRYALEMNKGWFNRHGIKVGAQLRSESLPVMNPNDSY